MTTKKRNWRRQQQKQRAEEKAATDAKRAAGLSARGQRSPTWLSDLEARLAEIPEDTRDLTAVVMGDPLPGRSALDKRGPFISALGR